MTTFFVGTDLQGDFIYGALPAQGAEESKDFIIRNMEGYDYYILTLDTHFKDGNVPHDQLPYEETQEGKRLPISHTIRGEDGWFIHPDIEKKIYDMNIDPYIIEKNTFGSLELIDIIARIIRQSGEEMYNIRIIFVGFCTDICVISNVLLAKTFFPEITIQVLEQGCAGVTKEKHEAALEVMRSCQIEIL